jgi:hypothetical protein
VNTSAQVGGAIGLALLATMSTNRTSNLLANGDSTAQALTGGYQLAFLIGAGLVVGAIGVALTVLRSAEAPQPAEGLDPEAEPAFSSEAA